MGTKTISDKYADEVEKNTQLSEQLKTVQAEADKVPALEQNVTDLQAKVDTLTTEAEQAKTDHAAAIQEKDAAITAKDSEITTLKGRLAMSPAHIQAGGTDPVKEQAGGDGQETKSIKEQFAAITDPAARSAFYRAHRNELLK